MAFKEFFKKWIEPFIAIGVIVMLIIVGLALSKEQELKREISKNCGWGDEDYYCYCEKSEAVAIRNRLNGSISDIKVVNVPDDIMNNWSVYNVKLDS